jgi:hypothetical protein
VKILLSEQQFNLILEASKTEILVNKIGFRREDAEELENLAGNFSVWLGKKIYEQLVSVVENRPYKKYTSDRIKEEVDNLLKRGKVIQFYRNEINSIVDWYRTGLNGNIKPYKNLTFIELYKESVKWHESLTIGGNRIDYVEKNPIIIDLRNDEEGFYWVSLGRKYCPEEAERMGHCARSGGYLYSLREYKKIPNNHTLNKSHLTASITSSGQLMQLKGSKNSKPKEEYNKYILPLFYFKNDGDYLIQRIGSEYEGGKDFQLVDLSEQEIIKLHEQRPGLFQGRKGKRALIKIGLIDDSETQTIFDLKILPKDVRFYVDGDRVVKSDLRGKEMRVFEKILSGEIFDLYNMDYRNENWPDILRHDVDEENLKIIRDLILQSNPNYSNIPIIGMLELKRRYEDDDEIVNSILNAYHMAYLDRYEEYVIGKLKKALNEYGDVIQMNNEGVIIRIDLKNILETGISEDDLDEFYEKCDDNLECVFDNMLGDYLDRPTVELPTFDNQYLGVDKKHFNEILRNYLYK